MYAAIVADPLGSAVHRQSKEGQSIVVCLCVCTCVFVRQVGHLQFIEVEVHDKFVRRPLPTVRALRVGKWSLA